MSDVCTCGKINVEATIEAINEKLKGTPDALIVKKFECRLRNDEDYLVFTADMFGVEVKDC